MEKQQKEFRIQNPFYSKTVVVCVMLFPMISHLALFWLGTQVESFSLAFKDEFGNFTLNNFSSVLSSIFTSEGQGSILKEAIGNTFLFFIVGVCCVPLHIFIAYMLYKKMWGYKVVRLAFYLPGMISSLMMAIMFQQLLMSEGPLLTLLNGKWGWGIPTPIVMEIPLIEINFFDVWIGIGGSLILWMGAMGRIPEEVLESAKLDGITPIKEFLHIIFPLIWPTFTTFITLKVVGILGSSGSVLLFTEGNYGTFTLSYWLYHIIYKGQTDQFGVGSALGLLMCLVSLPLVVLSRWFLNKFGEEVQY